MAEQESGERPVGVAPVDVGGLVDVMARLRGPDGCPWDREQTHRSLGRWLIEETWECLDAIDAADDEALRDELGDVLLQVVFHAQIASERGAFSLQDVVDAITRKMVRRHPHVFGDATVGDGADVARLWEQAKAAERGETEQERASAGFVERWARVSRGLPPLVRAEKVGREASRIGFDWPDVVGVLAKVREEVDEVERALEGGNPAEVEEELGDLLLAVSSLARHAGVPAERALRGAIAKFVGRLERVEELAAARGLDLLAMEPMGLDRLWDEVRASEAGQGSGSAD